MITNILIIGSTGFVGKNLVQFLENEELILLLPNRSDLNSISALFSKDTDHIIHLAGKAHDLRKTSDPNEYYETNFELTKKLYNSFLKSPAKKFIFLSSVKASADSVLEILNEDDLPDPKTHYGKSKLMAEEYITSQPLPEGKSYYILRPCMIHGPGNKGNLNLLYKFVQKGIPYPLAAFENKRSFLSVENLCFVIKSLMENDIPSGIYNVADDEALSTNEVVTILSESIRKKPKLWKISSTLIRFFAKIGDLIKLPSNTEKLNKLTENYIVNNSKIKRAINSELPLSTKEGLKITANSFR